MRVPSCLKKLPRVLSSPSEGAVRPSARRSLRESLFPEKLDSAGDKGEVTGLINIHRRLKIRLGGESRHTDQDG